MVYAQVKHEKRIKTQKDSFNWVCQLKGIIKKAQLLPIRSYGL
jgi:hypothetical protein